jgi:Family of unknown function (DUF5681)
MTSDENELLSPAPTRRRASNWKPGESGNPKGRAPGSKNKQTLFAEQLIAGQSEGIVRKVIECALAGDPACLKLALDRILPPLKTRHVNFPMPALCTTADALRALAMLTQGISTGQLLPESAEPLVATISAFIRAVETSQIEDRLAELEARDKDTARENRYDA